MAKNEDVRTAKVKRIVLKVLFQMNFEEIRALSLGTLP